MKNIDLFDIPKPTMIRGIKKISVNVWEVTKEDGTVLTINYSGTAQGLRTHYNFAFPQCTEHKGEK
jgi:hypothetical protein